MRVVLPDQADLILLNGKVYTVDDVIPWAEAIAVKDGLFHRVGSKEYVMESRGAETEILDLSGRFAMPGLYDMHTHPDLALAPKYRGDLDIGIAEPKPSEVREAILSYDKANPGDGWIFGAHWVRYEFRKEGIDPDRHWLDNIISHRPVGIMDRMWGSILVNSKALEVAGIDASTLDPPNGYIVRDDLTEEPTGILVDGAYAMIIEAMPLTRVDVLQRAYRDGVAYQSARGVVGTKYVHVCEHRLEALRRIDQAGELTLRVEAAISWQDDIFPVERRWELMAGERHFYRSPRLNANAVKFHFDGTAEPLTSYLATPWPGRKSWRGKLNMTREHLFDMVRDLDRRGIRVIAHCTGDGASDLFLSAIENARERNNHPGVRHQCAHSTLLCEENLAKFAALDVIPEFSPVGWYPDPFALGARSSYGEDRMGRIYNVSGVLDAGGRPVIGTDWPVSPINPWLGIETLVTRRDPWKRNDMELGQGISLDQAIRIATLNGAWAMDLEQEAGSITEGKRADLIILDRNLFEIEPQGNVHNTNVDLTIVDGAVVHDRLGEAESFGQNPVWTGEPADL